MPASIYPFKRLLSNYSINKTTGCWEWRGKIGINGYGQIKVFKKMVSVHRYSYELHKGKIPNGMEVMHQCNNKKCINPEHLSLGTHQDNIRNAIKDGLLNHKKIYYKPVKGIDKSQSKQVFAKGVAYGSMKEAERELNAGAGTISFWIKSKPHLARFITKDEYYQFINKGKKNNGKF